MASSKAHQLAAVLVYSLLFAAVCSPKLQGQRNIQDATPSSAPASGMGSYYALIIGNDSYTYLPKLQTAVSDANAVEQLLQDVFGFHTKKIVNGTREDIITALAEYRSSLPDNSNLLIYYAGHGHHDYTNDEAYWLPVDAKSNNPANWISAKDVSDNVTAIPSAHILVISDSCYSGYLTRGTEDIGIKPANRSSYLAKVFKSPSRTLMSSGGDEPVADSGAPGHSIFAWAILQSLRDMSEDDFTAGELFQREVQQRVAGRANQLPQYGFLRASGHESGDFVFHRVVAMPAPVVEARPNNPAPTVAATPTNASTGSASPTNAATGSATKPDSPQRSSSNVANVLASVTPAAVSIASTQPRGQSKVGWAIDCSRGHILHTEDGGHLWSQNTSRKQPLMSIAFASPNFAWVVGSHDYGYSKSLILRTQDSGKTWKKQCCDNYDAYLMSVAFATPSSGWAVGTHGMILHTGDGGGTWQQQSSGTNLWLHSITFASPELAWAVGERGMILHTEDGGRTWQQQSSGTDATLQSAAFASSDNGWAVGVSGTILHTKDGGRTWRSQSSGTMSGFNSITLASPELAWAVGDYGMILHTADAGLTWQKQRGDTNTPESLASIVFDTPESGWVVGEKGVILHTEDGGRTWQSQSSGTTDKLCAIGIPKLP